MLIDRVSVELQRAIAELRQLGDYSSAEELDGRLELRRQAHVMAAEPSSKLISLTYMSTATEPFGRPALLGLLEFSRERNDSAGLTGMLLHAGGHFIQTLEGPEDAVARTYGRIAVDPRHRDIIVALRETVAERCFGAWSMGFEEVSVEDATRLPGLNDFLLARDEVQRSAAHLGRAGVFHRVFRDQMR